MPSIRIALLAAAIPCALLAQVGTATLNGTIRDQTGAAVPNAALTLTGIEQQFERATVSDPSGLYVLPALPPGRYKLIAKAPGFRDSAIDQIQLSGGQASTLDVTLGVAETVEQVTVTGAPPLLQTANANVGAVIETKKLESLPVLGRNFTTLLLTLPGVSPAAPASSSRGGPMSVGGTGVNPSINGQRWRNNNYTLDGVANNEPLFNRVPVLPPPEALAEMKMEMALSSGANGHASGANINLVTKSGSNEFHGHLWEYFRNNKLDARSFFVPQIGAFRWNQFGAAAGGPLIIPKLMSRDRAWYVFGYYEAIRIRSSANAIALVPSNAQLGGDFSGSNPIFNPYTTANGVRQPFPNNQIPRNLLNQAALTYATDLNPRANLAPGVIPGNNYFNQGASRQNGDQWNGRADHQFGKSDNFFARYTDVKNAFASNAIPQTPSETTQRITNIVVSDTHIFDPSFLVTGRFGMTRIMWQDFTGGDLTVARRAGTLEAFPGFAGREVIIPVNIAGYRGLSQGLAYYGPQYQTSGIADAAKTKGTHSLLFGGSVMRTSFKTNNLAGTTVQFTTLPTSNFVARTGEALASFLLGTPESASRVLGNSEGDMYGNVYSAYFQDNWRVTSRLTVNLGLRWDFAPPMINRHGSGTLIYETGKYVWDITNPITNEPANIRRGVIDPDTNNFQPRFGAAYQINQKTVVRAGYGVFFDTFGINYAQTQQGNRGNWPFAFPQSVSNLNATTPNAFLQNPFPVAAQGSRTPLGCQQCLNGWNATSRTPYVHEWTFSVQRQLTPTVKMEANYFGSHGVKIAAQLIDNVAFTAGPGNPATRRRIVEFPAYVSNGYNSYRAYYNGLSLSADKQFSKGLLFSVNYTWSKAINFVDELSEQVSGGGALPTRANAAQWRGLAGWDVPHRFVASYFWAVPVRTPSRLANAVVAGWALSGILSFDAGLPYSARVNADVANIGAVAGRITQFPNLAGDPKAVSSRTPQQWFNTAAFALAPTGTFGNAGRNILRSDGLATWNFSAHKEWAVAEKKAFDLRGEFFNLFNQTTFGYPGFQVGTPQFGVVSSTRESGRQVQLALRFRF